MNDTEDLDSGHLCKPTQPDNQDAIWEYFQNEKPEPFSGAQPRLRSILRYMRPLQTILNIGVGSGIFEELALGLKLNVHSMDPSRRTIENLRAHLGLGERAQVGRCDRIPFPEGTFDAVVASEVLEHLHEEGMTTALDEIVRVLRPNGLFIGTVPAREVLEEQIIVCPHCKGRFHRWGHQQSFSALSLRTILSKRFGNIDVKERYFVNWTRLNWKGRIEASLKLFLSRLGIHGSNENLLFLVRKQ
jgi:SAM-dependent methyltransferase